MPETLENTAHDQLIMSAPQREDVKAKIRAYTQMEWPYEACGFIVRAAGNRLLVMPSRNLALDRLHDFKTCGDDWEAAEEKGEIVAIWHSHPNGKPELTNADKTSCETLQIPFLVLAWPANLFGYYEPSGWIHPLLGRPFVHGLLDCYSVVRDHYRIELGIQLPDFPRDDDWWLRKENVIMDNLVAAGFKVIHKGQPPADLLRRHDGLVIAMNHGIGNHCAVYLGDFMILHHPPWRPSIHTPYAPQLGGFYVQSTIAVVRHESLLDKNLSP